MVGLLALGPAEHAISVFLDGPYIIRWGDNGTKQAVHLGDPWQEWKHNQNRRLGEATEKGEVNAMLTSIAQGADVNCLRKGESLGQIVARNGHLAALEVLLVNKFNVNMGGVNDGSALVEAAQYGQVECVNRLLAVPGLNLHVTEDDKTALDWAHDPTPHAKLSARHNEVAALLEAVHPTFMQKLCNTR